MTTRADAHDDEFHKDQSWKFPVACATTANITLSGEQTIDGILTSASRVLVKDQGTGSQNGIYKTGSGAWTRAYDMDTGLETVGSLVFVVGGLTNSGTLWRNTNTSTVTIGSTALTFTQFEANAAAIAAGMHAHVIGEQMIGDGVSTLFYLAQEAESDQAPAAYVSGSRTDVTLGGMNDTITFGSAPSAAASIRVDYIPATS